MACRALRTVMRLRTSSMSPKAASALRLTGLKFGLTHLSVDELCSKLMHSITDHPGVFDNCFSLASSSSIILVCSNIALLEVPLDYFNLRGPNEESRVPYFLQSSGLRVELIERYQFGCSKLLKLYRCYPCMFPYLPERLRRIAEHCRRA